MVKEDKDGLRQRINMQFDEWTDRRNKRAWMVITRGHLLQQAGEVLPPSSAPGLLHGRV